MKRKAEVKVIFYKPRALKTGSEAPVLGQRHGTDTPSLPSEGSNLPAPDLRPLASRTMRQYISAEATQFVALC